MSTSGTVSFNLVTNEICDEAFDLVGIGADGEPITADMYKRAKRSLNLIKTTWGADPHLWQKTEATLALISGQAAYPIDPKPMRILSVRRRITNGQIDVPMNVLSRQDYFDTPNKAIQSTPTSYYYDPQTTTGTLYLWPAPSADVASSMSINFTWLRRMMDFTSSNDDADMPQEWLKPLCYALASEVGLKFGADATIRQEVEAKAAALYNALKGWDNEPDPIYLQPDNQWDDRR